MVLFLQRLFYPARTLAAIKRTTGSIQVYIYIYMIIYDMIYDYKCGNPFWWRRWCKMTCSLLWCGIAKSISQGTWAPKTSCLPNTECDGWWSLQIGNVGSEDWKLSMLSWFRSFLPSLQIHVLRVRIFINSKNCESEPILRATPNMIQHGKFSSLNGLFRSYFFVVFASSPYPYRVTGSLHMQLALLQNRGPRDDHNMWGRLYF